ncbi:MAG: Electron transport protein SCO1/SenC [Pedosphaera sp.]|nr:Electron transport protein SCO1/SenC [Pedosphaera sp.]
MLRWNLLICLTLLAGGVVACKEQPAPPAAPPTVASTNLQYFQVKGVVKEVKPANKSVVIKHEEVPNYMPAMTMPFDVKDTNELAGLHPGDAVSFRMVIAGEDAWIDQIKKLDVPRAAEPATPAPIRIVRDVDALKVGDPFPEYHFTNELGQAVNTSQFKGQALAFTFFFTRCPYPTFCPLVSNNFDEAQKKLAASADGPKNWHLLSISFDTENDSPATLKSYAEKYNYSPEHWNFVTGDPLEINAIADQVGETFWHDGPSITHNLRTVVIDAQGRVQKIIPENKWTSDELVAEMVKAAKAKP